MRMRARVVVLVGMLVAGALAPSVGPTAEAAPGCGRHDRPETGIPGDVPIADQISGRADEGYNCGLALVGFNGLGGQGTNGNMTWSDDCAYVASDGIKVVDVSDPRNPVHVRTLRGPGSSESFETLHAVTTPERAILVAGRYGVFGVTGVGSPAPVDVWDVRDCRNPVLLSQFTLPNNVHNLTLSADGRRMYSTLPLQAADLTDPTRPKFLGNLETDLQAGGVSHAEYAHEAWPSPDGRRLYVGGQIAGDEELLVIDVEGWPARRATAIGRTKSPGHSIRPATIDGKQYLINSDESVINLTAKGCVPELLTPVGGVSRPFLTDISDERNPTVRGQYRIPIGDPQNCLTQTLSGVNPSVHYQDVDDPDDTTFAMLSMWHSGLRVVDVRDPGRPREVAYFNPGRFYDANAVDGVALDPALSVLTPNHLDQAWAHSRYVPETGHIWLTTRSGGFWVLELEPQVRRTLDLPERPAVHPEGAIPRPAATQFGVGPTTGKSPLYCTLNSVAASILL